MKIKIGKHANDIEFYDDNGDLLKLMVAEVNMHILPGEMTKVELVVYADETDIEVDEDYLTTVRKKNR